MANFRIWAPWRLAYVKDASKDNEDECIFCAKPRADDDEANLIVHRGERCFVILNLYPYTNGHLMVAPYDHVGRLQEIPAETLAEMLDFAQRAMDRLGNIGIGYSFGGGGNFAGQRFAGRLASDPPGQMGMKEAVLAAGTAPQTSTLRWEDYTQTAVDPSDDCTIWYVGDYLMQGNARYSTRIGGFRMPGCR